MGKQAGLTAVRQAINEAKANNQGVLNRPAKQLARAQLNQVTRQINGIQNAEVRNTLNNLFNSVKQEVIKQIPTGTLQQNINNAQTEGRAAADDFIAENNLVNQANARINNL